MKHQNTYLFASRSSIGDAVEVPVSSVVTDIRHQLSIRTEQSKLIRAQLGLDHTLLMQCAVKAITLLRSINLALAKACRKAMHGCSAIVSNCRQERLIATVVHGPTKHMITPCNPAAVLMPVVQCDMLLSRLLVCSLLTAS